MRKKYYTNKGEVINFIKIKSFDNLPLVFGDEKNFKIFYNNLRKNNFPIEEIKIFHLFNSKRWDFVTRKNQTIKLPINNYDQSYYSRTQSVALNAQNCQKYW